VEQGISQLPEGEAKTTALLWVKGLKLATEDPAAAIQWTGELPKTQESTELMFVMARNMSSSHPKEAAALVAQMPEGTEKTQALAYLQMVTKNKP